MFTRLLCPHKPNGLKNGLFFKLKKFCVRGRFRVRGSKIQTAQYINHYAYGKNGNTLFWWSLLNIMLTISSKYQRWDWTRWSVSSQHASAFLTFTSRQIYSCIWDEHMLLWRPGEELNKIFFLHLSLILLIILLVITHYSLLFSFHNNFLFPSLTALLVIFTLFI